MNLNQPTLALALLAFLATPAFADKLDDDLAAAKAELVSGDADVAADKFDLLQATAQRAVTNKPDDAHAQYILGMSAMYLGNDAVAQRSLDMAMRLEPKNARYTFGRAELANYQNKGPEAVNILQRFADQDPKNAEAWDALGLAQADLRLHTNAKESFQKAADLAPKEPKYVARIAEALIALGKEDDAIAAFEKALTIDPKYPVALTSLGGIYQQRKSYDKALDLFSKAVAADPNDYRSIARQIQVYQATNNVKERDAALDKIRALAKAGKINARSFSREQFTHGSTALVVLEFFNPSADPTAPEQPLYAFVVLKPDGKTPAQSIQLSTTPGNAPKWSLDIHDEKQRQTLSAGAGSPPSYEDTRKLATDYLDGKLKPAQPATTPARGG